jgi:dGTP triphosphohydrolase
MHQRDDGRRNPGFTFAGAPNSMANADARGHIPQPSQNARRTLAGSRQHSFHLEFDFLPTRLIESPVFQRLRSVSQLGFVHRVWPQATHTRYDHSLGCYDLARSALAHIFSTLPPHMPIVLSREHLRTFLIAALLHDGGHLPFSHSLDGLRSLLPSHEQGGHQTSLTWGDTIHIMSMEGRRCFG